MFSPSGASIVARVREADETSTLLSFEENENSPVSALAGGHVAIQYTNRRGVCRVDGAAGRPQGVTLLRVEHTSEVQLIQRREFVRVDAILPVTYRPMGMTGWTAETTTINVSGGGFMISGRQALRMDQVMEFTITLDGDKEQGPLDVVGKVVREMPGGLGIEITQIEERERERLIRWVFARERLSMQMVKAVGQ